MLKNQAKAQILERDVLGFVRYFFRHAYGGKLLKNWHHQYWADILTRVISGELKRVIINVAPGSGKTEFISIMFSALSFALNPKSRMLHLSYSDELVQRNSRKVRDILELAEYKELYDARIRSGNNAVGLWATDQGGEFRAASTKSAVTGFRAGSLAFQNSYAGALIIDDPLKNTDRFSKPLLNKANEAVEAAINTRRAHPNVPVIMVMQRLCKGDTTDYVLEHCTGDWTVFSMPALIDLGFVDSLDERYRKLVVVPEIRERFSYWEEKESTDELIQREQKNAFAFFSEFQQQPIMLGGNLIKIKWFGRYKEVPAKFEYRLVTVDVAQKAKESSDYTVFAHWGVVDGRLYLLDILRGKWESLQRLQNALTFYDKIKSSHHGTLREFTIEQKVSGIDLFQQLKGSGIPLKEFEKNTDKFSDMMDVLTYIENGLVMIPMEAPWLADFETECMEFNAEMTHEHDDQTDCMVMAIKRTILRIASIYDYYKRK